MLLQTGCIYGEDTYLMSKPPSWVCKYFQWARHADKSSDGAYFTLVTSSKRRIFFVAGRIDQWIVFWVTRAS